MPSSDIAQIILSATLKEINMDLLLFTKALVGGILLGCSAILLLMFNGRIAGISGILGGCISAPSSDWIWRGLFIVGILIGGAIAAPFGEMPQNFGSSPVTLAIAGLLVGIGTRIGSGCTSGHGICGIGRFSPRSIIATVTFMLTAGITVFVRLHLL
ncbi:YeeE/YedE family protein [Parashewanella spongiae]|nr:YeeE/YedE family protein [Parashewanella spongiae]